MSGLRSLSAGRTWSVLGLRRGAARSASNWSRHTAFPGFFNRTPIPRSFLSSRALWLVPLGGGLAFCLSPTQNSTFSSAIFASPTLIPCSCPPQPIIYSPAEPDRSIPSRILSLLNGMVWEPIRTAGRFMHLFFIFIPLILSCPLLLMGGSGEGWVVWWYELLVSKMEAAGPTFIKVGPSHRFPLSSSNLSSKTVGTMGCFACRPFSSRTLRSIGQATF
jgi:aarF domain-containing kinase